MYLSIYSEFNEYCEVLEIQGLGKCMLKIFVQIISILNILLKKMAVKDLLTPVENSKSK